MGSGSPTLAGSRSLPGSRNGLHMTTYRQILGGTTYTFTSLVDLLAKATPKRSGDELAGCAASSEAERVAAKWALAEVPLDTFLQDQVVPYESDEVTRLIIDSHSAEAYRAVSHLTVGGLRDWLLDVASRPGAATILRAVSAGLTPEMVAAVSKLMRNQDLIAVGRAVEVVSAFRTTIGLPGRLSTRLQPNHPTDDAKGIAAALLDGLLLGCGDAVMGINPATDSPQAAADLLWLLDEVRTRFDIPTQSCVLSHVTTTMELIERNVPVDLVFQSVAGTEGANAGFGVNLGLLREANEVGRSLHRGTVGDNVMYLETGQGSALSAGAHLGTGGHPVDQQTLETRAYAVARDLQPLLVNTVVGFIGPEYLFDGKQILRAGLEDHFCGKLLGVPMGVDVCYTNHADADSDDTDVLLTLLGVAGAAFVIAVPGADDVMLGYQSLSFHDVLYARQVLGLRPAPEFEEWMLGQGMLDDRGRVLPIAADTSPLRALTAVR
jgi:ethanolamine ammonia-lyase large subunit